MTKCARSRTRPLVFHGLVHPSTTKIDIIFESTDIFLKLKVARRVSAHGRMIF